VEENIGDFHKRRADNLRKLKLEQVLKRKNPYLFKAKHVTKGQDLVESLLRAHLSSQEEAIFGEFLERLAIFVCSKVFGGRKSSAEGIDLEFKRDSALYIVSIKSGPNWGNSSQIKRMRDNFKQAQRILRTGKQDANIIAVNGCCYGTDANPNKGDYLKICGQEFWEFISGNGHLYIDIVEPLGHRAKERNEEFTKEYANIVNIFTRKILNNFCFEDGSIDWEKLIEFNSGLKTNSKGGTRP
jgi:hypothetical protein